MSDRDPSVPPGGVETTGHEWDGIEEYNNPLPRWWLVILMATIVWGIAFSIAYPAWPGFNASNGGLLGWSSRGRLEAQMAAVEAARAEAWQRIAALPLAELPQNPELMRLAVAGGASAFKVHCVQCHGSGGAGGPGYPNLNDDDWLWGGDIESLYQTIAHGIRAPGYDETRISQMPAFGRDGLLDKAQVAQVVEHVRALSGQEHDARKAAAGAAIFAEQCASCHGPEGKGNRELGAPNLTDAIWLYGGDRASLFQTIWNARNGVMPGWSQRLDDVTIRKLAAYVHSLGGGA
ncbi:cytochrome-c oxidase, cbb3-type subunit III [Thermaurantiacus tibetensis]|uniref:cytochrome-c oxidase, cbb3-type subunit III n=1 Tax=Thermaurantiacus tibetensis TaxID=2759035 RepID=UPI00188DEA55|nr:cytochrome-c oxidase, cbb3-type subunit III [Thermaurantiacus tibetensis]